MAVQVESTLAATDPWTSGALPNCSDRSRQLAWDQRSLIGKSMNSGSKAGTFDSELRLVR